MTAPAGKLVAYAVSTAVGSGKTRAAIEYIANPEYARQNFIYVAPTIRLIEQTADNLRKAIERDDRGRDVALIHSESRQVEDIPVAAQTTEIINKAADNQGLVVIITTTTFLKVLSSLHAPKHWRVIIDEGFSPVDFLKVHLGTRATEGLDHFLTVFAIDPKQCHRVLPAADQRAWVNLVGTEGIRRTGDQYTAYQPLAAAVANSIMRCELVMTPKTTAILSRTFVGPAFGSEHQTPVAAESVLLVASYVTPEPFSEFGQVVFMSALFEETLLYQMWTTLFGVTFVDHPAFPQATLRNIHADQGMNVEVGHLLHDGDTSSRYNLERNSTTGVSNEAGLGQRVIDHLVMLSADHFKGSRFLLQTNNSYGYFNGSTLMPPNAIKVPVASHGLNEFQDYDNVAALAVTNPNPQETQWIMAKTGLNREQTQMAFRIHTTYQAVGRSSIRKADPTSDRKVFLTVGHDDAQMLHTIFEGSTWLGQVGDMKSLSQMGRGQVPDTMEVTVGKQILSYLDGVSEDISKVSSRRVKDAVLASLLTSTWTRAVGYASERSNDWSLVGQSFVRRDAAYYGFTNEDGYTVDDEIQGRANVVI